MKYRIASISLMIVVLGIVGYLEYLIFADPQMVPFPLYLLFNKYGVGFVLGIACLAMLVASADFWRKAKNV